MKVATKWAVQLKDSTLAAEAHQLYLEHIDGNDRTALAGLVQALSSFDAERSLTYAERLAGSVSAKWADFDPEELELEPPRRKRNVEVAEGKPGAATDGALKKKKKRKIRYPKNYDPSNPGVPGTP